MTEPTTTFSPALRRLHLAVAVLVTTQLVIGLVMSPRHTPQLFLAHQLIGLVIAALVLVHWLWLVGPGRAQLANLFPYGGAGTRTVLDELAQVMRLRMPASGPRPGLPGLIHGLGLLALTAVAGLGTALYVLIRTRHIRSSLGETLGGLHTFFAWLLIVYWCGHVLLAMAHEARGDHVIARILRLGRTNAPSISPTQD